MSLLVAFGSANSGIAALFDALNVVYNEREKRSFVRFYAITFLFTLVGIAFVIMAIIGELAVPLVLNLFGLATVTEKLVAVLRWPILLVTVPLAIRPSSRKNMIRASAGNFRSRRVGMVRNSAKARLEVLQQLP